MALNLTSSQPIVKARGIHFLLLLASTLSVLAASTHAILVSYWLLIAQNTSLYRHESMKGTLSCLRAPTLDFSREIIKRRNFVIQGFI
jgi:hypothetical protein